MMRKLSVVVFLLSIAGAAVAEKSVTVSMKSSVTLEGAKITLADVAQLKTANASLTRQLTGINLGATPLPGNARTISRKTVLIHLVRQGINADTVAFDGARFCVTSIKSVTVKGEDIAQTGRKHLLSLPLFQRKGISIEAGRIPNDKNLPARGERPVLTASAATVSQPWGNIQVYVRIKRGTETVATVPLIFRVTCKVNILVAARTIRRGGYITARDLKAREVQLGPSSGNVPYVTDAKDAVGKQAVKAIAAGAPLTSSMIAAPFIIRKGQGVAIHLEHRGLKIVTKGVALDNAKLGESVMVRILLSGKEASCTATEAGKVTLAMM